MAAVSPEINVHIQAPDFELITPEAASRMPQERVFVRGGVKIVKVAPTLVMKYGDSVQISEARTLEFVRQHTSIPVPRVYAAYTYGPFEERDEEWNSKYDTYIFLDFVEGQTLEKEWGNLGEEEKLGVMHDLRGYLEQLRAVPGGSYIGSLDDGPVMDPILENLPNKGPFPSEDDFNATLVDAYSTTHKGHIKPYMSGMLAENKHTIVFTHADLRPDNIMIKDEHVTGIIDWEMAGWYPEHWEFVKAFYICDWRNDWGTRLLGAMKPYYYEQLVHARLTQILF
ncbi:hypothetical protein LSUE1_G002994 [Lachnellula suecica]|uniref:Aminoglycoside phosphotransferase domain-containing protein n=1 Tax=Lachnellula suecica TaxID=602035 RepID=A0A8T9CG94_9HELO|nr:hypothetical protein LSUE1_G002994 [Lachnellula suecica]